jgi:hypothetical protein
MGKRKTPSPEAALERELYKIVSKVPLVSLLPDRTFPPGEEFAVVDRKGNILNFCSDVYKLVHNSDVFIPIEMELRKQHTFRRNLKIVDGVKFYADYILSRRIPSTTIGDILPALSIRNSYDGKIKYGKDFGFYRLPSRTILSSMNMMAESNKHTDIVDTEELKDMMKLLNSFLIGSKKDMELFDKMNKRRAGAKKLEEVAKELGLSAEVTDLALSRFAIEVKGGSMYENDMKMRTRNL